MTVLSNIRLGKLEELSDAVSEIFTFCIMNNIILQINMIYQKPSLTQEKEQRSLPQPALKTDCFIENLDDET
jgi:hypothetical protein